MIIDSIAYFILGIIFGSFYNVIAMRSIAGEQWISGRSRCDSCGSTLGVIELIPIISYIIQKGKCKHCGANIPIQHLIAEISFGLLLVIFKPDIIGFIVLSVMMINTISDLTAKVTITSINVIALAIIFVYNLYIGGINTQNIISAGLIVGVIILNKLFKDENKAFGLGDIDILLILAVYNGVIYSIECLAYGCIASILVILPLAITKKITLKSEVPLVPFIFTGLIIRSVI